VNKLKKIKRIGCSAGMAFLLFFMVSQPVKTYASILDTTLFRIKVLQDTVYAGDTVDVDFYLGDEGLLGIQNILNQFEMEVATDTSLILQDQIQFKLDTASLAAFFNTLFSNLNITQTIDPVLGILNVKAKSNKLGSGNARVGRGQYIVQDNVAGRYMHYNFTKAISKGLLGFINPVKTIVDSVYIGDKVISAVIKPPTNNSIKIFPNPVGNYIDLEGEPVLQFTLCDMEGAVIRSEVYSDPTTRQHIDMSDVPAGIYVIFLQTQQNWTSYKMVKY
jgi:hypothetical protein